MKETLKPKEEDLYKPIQRYFKRHGYDVYGEVKDCDITLVKEDELVIIELKLNLSVDLLIQATKRQRMTESVYIAVPKPKYNLRSKRWRDTCHLVRRLELGLILVSLNGSRKKVEVVMDPTPFDRKKSLNRNKRKRQSIMTEINGRSGDYNIGGSTRKQIMTAYRENCIQIACYLQHAGELSPKALVQLGTGNKTASILTKNYYGWFERIRRGIYILSEKGKNEVEEYPDLLAYYRKNIPTTKTEKDKL
ncbi:DUF2161 family putative PD-(D/E)XK-type phosphodiesterase [Aquibacillus koreensis]|uniref:DUF2161 family putative PD-(D/E)XK-type phosphodiesterase n=2 Tax=Aquibacillus koreensis TaxID=279446 RepID=A0A9X3WJV6_9BACI|nr:DUF2161 family putative PD-(D/E)XK-type phosphodiesterase [Aquibacillus koreensis]MCT2535181.1 DUF2161 family putative PD-(D/E)XK-type phosphodiesterase [Aquibacillus koreensis]MDC3421040.1 DUF2161 family putative PD-(D/E)XK-type phosphodiesterase [Aquibacillus koreensis]